MVWQFVYGRDSLVRAFIYTGLALMMDARDDFSHEVAAYLQARHAGVRVCNWATDTDDHPFLSTVTCFCDVRLCFVHVGFSIGVQDKNSLNAENI